MSLTFEGVDVVASCDYSASFSSVTSQFLIRRLGRSNSVFDIPIRAVIFISDGVLNFSTDFSFVVVDHACSDVVFGRDWLAYCRDIADNHRDIRLPVHQCCFLFLENNGPDHGSSMNGCATGSQSDVCAKGEAVVRNMLFSVSTTSSLFSADPIQLSCLVRDHGLPMELPREEMKNQLLRHLLSGLCIDAGAGPSGPRSCTQISRGFLNVSSLLGYIVREVTVSLSSTLSVASLKDIVRAAGEESSLVHANRADLIRLLSHRCVTSSGDDIVLKELFLGFETLSHSSLHSYAIIHGIQFQSGSSREDLLQMLMQHLSDGSCLHGKDLYAGCSSVCSACHCDYSMDAVGLQIQLLDVVGSRMSVKPLRRLFRIHHVQHSADDSLRVLRKKLRSFVSMLKKGKQPEFQTPERLAPFFIAEQTKDKVRQAWPRLVDDTVERKAHEFK
ncbi:hypothetical protein C8R48DRAFT_836856 [Suillus tomentosus]|nr:hypothetical protein C8R48DRAFT_836856 [Suillus tomentosus]